VPQASSDQNWPRTEDLPLAQRLFAIVHYWNLTGRHRGTLVLGASRAEPSAQVMESFPCLRLQKQPVKSKPITHRYSPSARLNRSCMSIIRPLLRTNLGLTRKGRATHWRRKLARPPAAFQLAPTRFSRTRPQNGTRDHQPALHWAETRFEIQGPAAASRCGHFRWRAGVALCGAILELFCQFSFLPVSLLHSAQLAGRPPRG